MHHPGHFCLLPSDTLLEIACHLSLSDVLIFFTVCSHTLSLSLRRFAWIFILERERKIRPIAFRSKSRLADCTLEELRDITVKTVKLEESWSQDKSIPINPVKTNVFRVDEAWPDEDAENLHLKFELISFIAGTNLLLIYLLHREELICVNVITGNVIVRFPMGPIMNKSIPYEECEKWSLALLIKSRRTETSEPRFSCIVLEVTLTDPIQISASFKVSLDTRIAPPDVDQLWNVFLYSNVVGLIRCLPSLDTATWKCTVESFDIRTRHSHQIDFETGDADDMQFNSHVTIHQGHVYIVFDVDYGKRREAYHIPRRSLPFDDHTTCSASSDLAVRFLGSLFVEHKQEWLSAGRRWAEPMYGVSSVEIFDRFLSSPPMTFITNSGLRFYTHAFADDISSPLVLGNVAAFELPQSILQLGSTVFASSYSGLNVAVVLCYPDRPGASETVLVRYHPELDSITSHVLVVPSSLRLQCCGIAIDDYLGHIAILHEEGRLYCLTYT